MIKTLKGKITLVYLCLVVLIAIVGTTASINLFDLSKAIDGLMIANYKSINATNNMIEALERQDNAVLIYINVDRKKGKLLFAENNETFLKWYNIEYNNVTEKGEAELVRNIKTAYTEYVQLFLDLQEIRSSEKLENTIGFYDSKIMPSFIRIKENLKNINLINEKAMFTSKEKATRNATGSMYLVLSISVVAIFGGYVTAVFLTNRFLRPMVLLTQNMKLVQVGDINQYADIKSKDEIGQLAHEFNNMTKRLMQYEQSTLGKLLLEKNKSLAIVKSISDPLIVLDTSYRIVLMNNACEKVFNVNEDDLINKHFLEGIRNGEIYDFLSGTFEAQEDTRQKIFIIKSIDGELYYNIIIVPVKDNEAKLSGLIAIFQNVTQLKELEKIRTDFIATISHEFKTPLTSIMMGADVILQEGVGSLNEEQKQIMAALRDDSERLTSLVSDLLELTRIESGKAIYKIQEYSFEDIIDFSIKQFYYMAKQSGVKLDYICEEKMPYVLADFEKITWVLNNLISNALKYTRTGDEINIRGITKDEKVYVTVKDTGIGIPEEYQDRIFEKFVQVKDFDYEMRGTGLGLAVVKEIIQAHNGEIWCESKLDAGSSFIFTLNVSKGKRL